MNTELMMKVAIAFEMAGGVRLSDSAKDLIFDALEPYDEIDVSIALSKCMREVRGRLCPADIISRIPSQRPSANEAWAMIPRSEEQTVVWTDEMRVAWSVAYPIMDDKIAARMAFIEAYNREMTKADSLHKPKWSVSLGTDVDGRRDAILGAMNAGRLSEKEANGYLGWNATETKLLTDGNSPATIEQVNEIVSQLMKKLEA